MTYIYSTPFTLVFRELTVFFVGTGSILPCRCLSCTITKVDRLAPSTDLDVLLLIVGVFTNMPLLEQVDDSSSDLWWT